MDARPTRSVAAVFGVAFAVAFDAAFVASFDNVFLAFPVAFCCGYSFIYAIFMDCAATAASTAVKGGHCLVAPFPLPQQ